MVHVSSDVWAVKVLVAARLAVGRLLEELTPLCLSTSIFSRAMRHSTCHDHVHPFFPSHSNFRLDRLGDPQPPGADTLTTTTCFCLLTQPAMVLHSLPWNSFITLPPARVSSIAALFILQCPGIWPVQSSFHSFDALPSPLFSYGTTHQSSAKALDKAVAKHWKAGEYLSQQALTKLSAKLQQKGLAPISNWPNYRKAYLERCARARAAKDKRGKTQDARAVVKLFLKDRLGAAAKAVASYIVARYSAGVHTNGPLEGKARPAYKGAL